MRGGSGEVNRKCSEVSIVEVGGADYGHDEGEGVGVEFTLNQTSIKCATARPSVIDSEGPSSIIKDPNIRSFFAKSVLARFTRFLGVRTQPLTLKAQTKHCQIGQLHY